MSRTLKPTKVGTISVGRHQGTLDVMFDRNKRDFFVAAGLEIVRDPTVKGCEEKASEYFREWRPEKWEGVIEVHVNAHHAERNFRGSEAKAANIDLAFYRLEVAWRLDGQKVQREHQLDHEAELKAVKRQGFHSVNDLRKVIIERRRIGRDVCERYDSGEDAVEIPYSDEAWEGLMRIKATIEDAHAKLLQMVQAEGLEKRLLGIGTGGNVALLGGGQSDPPRSVATRRKRRER